MPLANAIAEQQLARFVDDGFVVIEIPDAVQRQIKDIFDGASEFFDESDQAKLLSRLPQDAGYRPYGVEYSQSSARPDQIESFTANYRIPPSLLYSIPDKARHLYNKMLKLFDVFETAAENLVIQIAERITGKSHFETLQGGFHAYSVLQLNYSKPSQLNADYVHELHEDGSLVTISSVTGPGFELQTKDGSFLPLTPCGKEILFISGEILWLLSGGRVRPVYHRVQPASSSPERMSLLFFADLRPDLCIPWVKSQMNENVAIGERVLKNGIRFGLSEWKSAD